MADGSDGCTPATNAPGRTSLRGRGACVLWLLMVVGVPAAGIGWAVLCDPDVEFLPPGGSGRWVVGHDPGRGPEWVRDAVPRVTFERTFHAAALAPSGRLVLRANKSARVELNGRQFTPSQVGGHWKEPLTFVLADALADGDNRLVIEVDNPGQVAALRVDEPASLRTPFDWWGRAQGAGPPWRALTVESLPQRTGIVQAQVWWPWARWLVTAGMATAVLVLVAAAWSGRRRPAAPAQGGWRWSHTLLLLVVFAAAAWLHVGNAGRHNWWRGPDARGHMQHVVLVARTGRPALAGDGWQCYHPPGYYFIAAAVYRYAGGSLDERAAQVDAASPAHKAVQFIGPAAALVLMAVAFALARRLLPAQPAGQVIATALAGLTPIVLAVAPLVNNETLAAAMIGLALWAALGWLERMSSTNVSLAHGPAATWRWAVPAGLAVGAAMLFKFSALILALSVTLAAGLAWWARPTRRAAGSLVAFVLTVTAVCGWYYLRNVANFGTPFYGNWQAFPGLFPPYFRWLSFYLPSGASVLAHIDQGAWSSWWDGLYNSLWTGDRWFFFADWMHVAMTMLWVVLVLAWPLTVAMGIGLAMTIRRAWGELASGQAGVEVLLASLVLLTGASLVWFSIRIPAHGSVTARYLLYLLPVLGVLAARGRARIDAGSRWVRMAWDANLVALGAVVMVVFRLGAFGV